MKHRHSHIKNKLRKLKPKRSIFTMPFFWITVLILLILIAILYLVFFFPKFQITTIDISGNQTVKTQDIESVAQNTMHIKSIFLVNTNNVAQALSRTFLNIDTAQVQKKWPNSIIVTIKERQPFAVFCPDYIADPRLPSNRDDNQNPEKCFLVDKHGVAFEFIENIPQDMFVINSDDNHEVVLGKETVKKDIIDMIAKITQQLKDNFQIGIEKIKVANDVILTTTEGWQIYFDPTLNIDSQITRMNLLLKNEISAAVRKNLHYIYLQYENRAYYK